jgi:hypothetical protein
MKKFVVMALFVLVTHPVFANTYYIAPESAGGSDSNTGTSASAPWLTPNHAINCGDVILAAAGTYAEGNFRPGQWGTVTCPGGNNVAWLKCATFDTCRIVISNAFHDAMTPTKSYWGIQGWEVTASTVSTNQCFEAYPPDSTHTIHHIIFANNIANGCGDGAFTTGASAPNVGVDYVAFVGNIAYNGAQDNAACYSGIDIVVPVNSDTLPGTHMYIAGNFVWGNVDPNPCSNGIPTDGQGINLDTVNGNNYSGQIVIENNISVFNGAAGIQSFLNAGRSPNASIYIRNNTTYGNQSGGVNAYPCAEINLNDSLSTQVSFNLVQSQGPTGCRGTNIYSLGVTDPDSTVNLYDNFIYSAAGNNTAGNGEGFTFSPSNVSGANPSFANSGRPSAPNCKVSTSVPNCMANLISNFTPTAISAKSYGYQIPHNTPTYDPLFPQWLCNVDLPAGLVTMGCTALSSLPAPVTIISVSVQ